VSLVVHSLSATICFGHCDRPERQRCFHQFDIPDEIGCHHALLLAYYDKDGRLHYAGRAGGSRIWN
jgi:hypothetical protein